MSHTHHDSHRLQTRHYESPDQPSDDGSHASPEESQNEVAVLLTSTHPHLAPDRALFGARIGMSAAGAETPAGVAERRVAGVDWGTAMEETQRGAFLRSCAEMPKEITDSVQSWIDVQEVTKFR